MRPDPSPNADLQREGSAPRATAEIPSVSAHMEDLRPGHYWKTPFVWEEGCPEPRSVSPSRFAVAEHEWFEGAVAQTMACSLDESDRFAVSQAGPSMAASDLIAMAPKYFDMQPGCWRVAKVVRIARVTPGLGPTLPSNGGTS